MTSKVVYLGELRTEATHLRSGQKIITDAPVDNEGRGEAFSPTDLCATSLASCLLTIMGIAAKKRNMNMQGTTAEVVKVMAENPRRISEIIIDIRFPDDLSEKDRNILVLSAKHCPVSNSISSDVKETLKFS